nr:MAG TPA: hypothetical protein [Caudoviricetes sp.]
MVPPLNYLGLIKINLLLSFNPSSFLCFYIHYISFREKMVYNLLINCKQFVNIIM